MTETATAAPQHPFAAMAAPIRAAFTAAMTPYANGEAVAPLGLTKILIEAVTAADPTPELIGMLCHLVTSAAPDTDTLSIMHRAMGAALGLGGTTPARSASPAARPAGRGTGATKPGTIGADILGLFAANPEAEFTVTELAKHLGRGTGATGAAISGLINRGEAVMTGESPRRYSAPATDAADAAPTESGDAADATPAPAGH